MLKRPLRPLAMLALLMGVGLAACETDVVSVLDSTVDGSTDLVGAGNPVQLGQPELVVMVATPVPQNQATAVQVVSASGGQLQVGPHKLIVPPGAVNEETEFTMTVAPGNHFKVHLSARRVRDGGVVSQFPKALTLQMSYNGGLVVDASRLRIAYLVDGTNDGRKDVLQTSVDAANRTVSSPVVHFSPYAIVHE